MPARAAARRAGDSGCPPGGRCAAEAGWESTRTSTAGRYRPRRPTARSLTQGRGIADERPMARAMQQARPLDGALAALRQTVALIALALLPAALVVIVVGGAIGHQFAFDFHGSIWQAARDVLHGHNPYPPPTAAGVAPGDRFVYPPAVAFAFIPLGVLPFPVAAACITLVLLAAVAATLYVLEVRDWRCYGAAYLSIPVLHDVRLGALTPLLALGIALAWRWRDRTRSAIPLAFVIVAKLFLWPLGVWLLATGRVRVALRTALYGLAASAIAWAAIGFAGLSDYPRLLRVLASAEQARGYSPVSALLALGLGGNAARVVATAIGLVLLACCAIVGRRGDDRRSLILPWLRPRAVADRLAPLLRAAARADRARTPHVLGHLARARALLGDPVRGAFRRPLAHRRRHRRGGARPRGVLAPANDTRRNVMYAQRPCRGLVQAVSRSPQAAS